MNTPPLLAEAWYQTKEFLAAVGGATLAFALVVLYDYLRSRRRRRAHFAALRAELNLCHELAQTYQRDNVAAPLYRLPAVAYAHSLPALLAEASLSENELNRLLTFFNGSSRISVGSSVGRPEVCAGGWAGTVAELNPLLCRMVDERHPTL